MFLDQKLLTNLVDIKSIGCFVIVNGLLNNLKRHHKRTKIPFCLFDYFYIIIYITCKIFLFNKC